MFHNIHTLGYIDLLQAKWLSDFSRILKLQ